jgi:hypothetical protein
MSITKEQLQRKYDGCPIDLKILQTKQEMNITLAVKSVFNILSNYSIGDVKEIIENVGRVIIQEELKQVDIFLKNNKISDTTFQIDLESKYNFLGKQKLLELESHKIILNS